MGEGGQAGVVAQLFPLLGALADGQSDRRARDCLLGAMRAARWWFVATARVDAGESGIHARGGFLVDAGQDEALEADVLAYYLFGSMILDRLAAYATGTDLDGAWKRWLKALDGGPATQTRSLSRQLDIWLRVTRDKLVAHIGLDAKFTCGVSGPGTGAT